MAATYFKARARDPRATYADASYVYARNFAPDSPYAGDVLQIAFAVIGGATSSTAGSAKLESERK